MHSKNIVHCDLKLPNIMIDLNGTAKIIDLGVAHRLKAEDPEHPTEIKELLGETLSLLPPEYRAEKKISPKFDIWDLGIVIYQLFTEQNAKTVFIDQNNKFFDKNAPTLSPTLDAIIAKCMSFDRNDRPSAEDLKKDLLNLKL